MDNDECEYAPRGQGYWKRICESPHPSDDSITWIDLACANRSATFEQLQDEAGLCAELHPDPQSDKCEQAEAQLIALLLNVCRYRVPRLASLESQCGSNSNVEHALMEVDALLSSTERDHETCSRAQCLADEINSGVALRTNTLMAARFGDRFQLTWSLPFTPDVGPPRMYEIWRRFTDGGVFELVGETTDLTWEEPLGDRTAEYSVRYVW